MRTTLRRPSRLSVPRRVPGLIGLLAACGALLGASAAQAAYPLTVDVQSPEPGSTLYLKSSGLLAPATFTTTEPLPPRSAVFIRVSTSPYVDGGDVLADAGVVLQSPLYRRTADPNGWIGNFGGRGFNEERAYYFQFVVLVKQFATDGQQGCPDPSYLTNIGCTFVTPVYSFAVQRPSGVAAPIKFPVAEVAPGSPLKPARAALARSAARRYAVRRLRARRPKVSCRRVTRVSYSCRASWRRRGARVSRRVTVSTAGGRSARVRPAR